MRRFHRFAATLRQGYTLLELVITMPLLTMLLLGMASAVHLAARSVPDGKSSASASVAAAGALDRLTTELGYATTISARTARDITFITPDRSGDGVPDTVRYRWSGAAGAPLLRSLHSGPDETLLPSVQQFAMTYDAPIDAASGLPLLRTVEIQLLAPAGTTKGIVTTIPTHNRPQLP